MFFLFPQLKLRLLCEGDRLKVSPLDGGASEMPRFPTKSYGWGIWGNAL